MSKNAASERVYSVAVPADIHRQAAEHLLAFYRIGRRQENLCFALWRPSEGSTRLTALVHELVLPEAGELLLRGNVSFTGNYLRRACARANQSESGLVLMHNHFGPEWQDVSPDDATAERTRAAFVLTATDLPLVGMTIGTDESWSARFWPREGHKRYVGRWCHTVRVVGPRLNMTFHPALMPPPAPRDELIRTISAWGQQNQAVLARTHVGVVGVGSVGRLAVECLARIGVAHITVIDFDWLERKNLDRQICAYPRDADLGRSKVEMAHKGFLAACTAAKPRADSVLAAVTEPTGFEAALDCDAIFCCVDRPWARHVLNHLAYAHLIPVIEGGIVIRTRNGVFRGAEWSARTAGPGRCCLSCAGAYDVGLVDDERRGLLDDPSYIAGLPPDVRAMASQNVMPFSLSLAGHMAMQFAALVTGMLNMPDLGDQRFHYNLREIRTTDRFCHGDCSAASLTATGHSVYPADALTSVHPAAEVIRAAMAARRSRRSMARVLSGLSDRIRALWEKARGSCVRRSNSASTAVTDELLK